MSPGKRSYPIEPVAPSTRLLLFSFYSLVTAGGVDAIVGLLPAHIPAITAARFTAFLDCRMD